VPTVLRQAFRDSPESQLKKFVPAECKQGRTVYVESVPATEYVMQIAAAVRCQSRTKL
jgi:hypothetical protein